MPFSREKIFGTICAAVMLGQIGSAVQAEDIKATYESQVGYALHLLEAGRYSEAEDAAQNLVTAYPDAALPFELRGTAALYVGSVGRAQKDFTQAALGNQDANALYGLALCDLFTHKLGDAQGTLTDAGRTSRLLAAQARDIETASAYVKMLGGDAKSAVGLSLGDDPLRQEIAALAAYRTDPKAGAAQLTQYLATPGGVPIVREADGLRPLFDVKTPIESCVIEPDLRQMYADRLAGNISAAVQSANGGRLYSGLTDLTPSETPPSRTAIFSYSVDGRIAAMVGQAPYTFTWNTRRVANGIHTIQRQAADSNGNTLLTETETVHVRNIDDALVQQAEADPATEALKMRLWNLLRLRPCRKVAEWTLAQYALATGDRVSADQHRAVAAALDPDYKDGRRFARALFGFPVVEVGQVALTRSAVLWTGNVTRKQIALTFDDGPNRAKTPALLDALDTAHAPATFFVVGSRAELAPDLLRRMTARGDEVENHSYTHPNMNLLIPAEAESEILRGSVMIQALTGHQPHFFRPPGGNANPAVQRLARVYGLSLAYWTVDALHAEDIGSPLGLTKYVLAHVHPGSIVLMHNAPDVTTAAIPSLVAGLRAQGYSLVTLSEIAKGQAGIKPKAMPKMKE